MKKLFLILFVALAPVLHAQRVGRTLIHMEKLYRDGMTLQAMDSAAYVLSVDNDNFVAKNFLYRHWDKTMTDLGDRLAQLTDEKNLDEARERLLLLRQLDEIHTYLRTVPMPLYGPNDRWVWQPEVGYYAGMYDTERMKTYDLVLGLAEQALQSYDIESAQSYYDFALQELFVDERERNSNHASMLKHVNRRITELAESENIYEVIAAYNMVDLSLWLDASQKDKPVQKQAIQQEISDMYLQLAKEYAERGDTILSKEHSFLAEDWKVYTDTIQ